MKHFKKYYHYYLISFIVLIAILLRFYQLGNVPISPDWDEASLGYNAYSILMTGHDEYGKFLPPVIESFGDYKPALYSYLAIPSIAMFGLSVFAVRLPGAIMGVVAVIATYFLVDELFKRKKLALLSSFFLAISPWSLQFSRVAFEAALGDTFVVLTVLFFLKGLKKTWFLYLSVICAALNLYIYQSEKVFSPLIFLLLVIIFNKQILLKSRKILLALIVTGIIFSAPMVIFTISNSKSLERLTATDIFATYNPYAKPVTWLLGMTPMENLQDKQNHDVLGLLLDNRKVILTEQILSNYLMHFNPNWLLMPDNTAPRHHAPQMGLIYLSDFVFLLIGIYSLFYLNVDRRSKWLIFGWFLLSPVPASVTIEVPHAVRTLNFLPTFQIFISLGLLTSFEFIKNKYGQKISLFALAVFILVLMFNVAFYLDNYFVQYNYYNSQDWQYGYAKLVPYLQSQQNNYKKIIVSNAVPLDQSYIFFLFYLKYPPSRYQHISETLGSHYTQDHAFGKFEFRPISVRELKQPVKGYLYVIGANQITKGDNILKTIDYLNNQPAIFVIKG